MTSDSMETARWEHVDYPDTFDSAGQTHVARSRLAPVRCAIRNVVIGPDEDLQTVVELEQLHLRRSRQLSGVDRGEQQGREQEQ